MENPEKIGGEDLPATGRLAGVRVLNAGFRAYVSGVSFSCAAEAATIETGLNGCTGLNNFAHEARLDGGFWCMLGSLGHW